jgi:hypothetical protein
MAELVGLGDSHLAPWGGDFHPVADVRSKALAAKAVYMLVRPPGLVMYVGESRRVAWGRILEVLGWGRPGDEIAYATHFTIEPWSPDDHVGLHIRQCVWVSILRPPLNKADKDYDIPPSIADELRRDFLLRLRRLSL